MIAFTQINPRTIYDETHYHMFAKNTSRTHSLEFVTKTIGHFSEKESWSEFRLEFIL